MPEKFIEDMNFIMWQSEYALDSHKNFMAKLNSEDEQTKIGYALIEMLGLKVSTDGRVKTAWGDKTPLGLAKSVFALYV